MFDVYVFEAHPQTTMEGLDFRDISAATNMQEKIENYELYLDDHKGYGNCKPTIPGLLDDMNETWRKNRTYGTYYTSIWVINKEGKFEYTVYFAHPTYSGGDPYCYEHLEPCLDTLASTSPIITDYKNIKISSTISYSSDKSRISLFIPDEGKHFIQLVNPQGRSIFLRNGIGTQHYDILKPFTSGKYYLRIVTDKQALNIPTIICR